MTPDIKLLYRAILKERCLIAPHETGSGLLILSLWDSAGQTKKYTFTIDQRGGVKFEHKTTRGYYGR